MKILIPFLFAAASLPAAALAQNAPVDSAQAGRALSEHLNTLSTDSRNVRALIGAGEAAITLEDANAAIGFFGRAEEVDPRNARIKAGLARALLMLEKPREAIKLFDNAEDLGMDEALIAGDRGLAYDLRGDSRRAQKDYALALKRGPDPEITRRMALSLAISGDREQALQLLEPLLRAQDRAAWRAQAFVLAMVGDAEGANRVARQVMPGNLAKPMAPFFARMAGLSAAQKAAAVHFGAIPSDGRSSGALYTALEAAPPSATRSASGGGDDPDEPDFDLESAPAQSAPAAQRTPSQVANAALSTGRQPAPGRIAQSAPAPRGAAGGPAEPAPAPSAPAPGHASASTPGSARTVQASPPPPQAVTGGSPAASTPAGAQSMTASAPVRLAQASPSNAGANPGVAAPGFSQPPVPRQGDPRSLASVAQSSFSLAAGTGTAPASSVPARPAPVTSAPVLSASATPLPATPPPATPPAPTRSLAAIVGGLELEKTEAVPIPAPAARKPAPKPTAVAAKADEKKPAAKKPEPKKPDPKKAEPERIWAQVATGASAKALATDFGKMAKKSPAAFKGMTGWTVPFRGTRRLLVGPFASEKKAQDFLKKAGITGFAWTSPAGTEIEKLAAR